MATHFLAPGQRGCSTIPLATVLPPPAPRRRPSGPAESSHEQTLPRWLLPDADTRIGKERTESDLDDRPLSILVWHQTGRFVRKKSPILPTRRRSTGVESLFTLFIVL